MAHGVGHGASTKFVEAPDRQRWYPDRLIHKRILSGASTKGADGRLDQVGPVHQASIRGALPGVVAARPIRVTEGTHEFRGFLPDKLPDQSRLANQVSDYTRDRGPVAVFWSHILWN